jgi:aryl-alcohol dehydrogenase-like predicted oxidoreductase
VTALQTGYSRWTTDPEREILPVVRVLGTGFVACFPLGRGFLPGRVRSAGELGETGFRRDGPRFAGDNFRASWRVVEVVGQVAAEIGATSAQIALACCSRTAATSCRSPEHAGANGSRRTSVPTRSNCSRASSTG